MAISLFFVGAIAILAPWAFTRTGRRVVAGLTPAFVATYAWLAYELAVEPKPLGRLDLIILGPLFVLVWFSGLASLVLGAIMDEMGHSDRDANSLKGSVEPTIEETPPKPG